MLIININNISHVFVVFLLLTLNKQMLAGKALTPVIQLVSESWK